MTAARLPDFDAIPSPCFVLDEAALRRNLELADRVQCDAGVEVILALKGVAMTGAFPLVRQYLPGCTASSLNEAKLAREFHGGEIHAYCPTYPDDRFEELCGMCSHLSFNSMGQYQRYRGRCAGVSMGLRINPEYSPVTTELYNPCLPGSRFGVRAAELADGLPEDIEGLHSHNLCESDSYALEETLKRIEALFGHCLGQIKWLNLGGGHLFTRADYNVEHLIETLRAFKARFPHLRIILEPGSAIGWQAGWLVSTVQDIFTSGDVRMLMLDVSFACHMPDCLEMPYKPTVLGATDAVEGGERYRLGGCSCLSGDWIGQGDYAFKKPPAIGDRLVFDDMIHYTIVKTTMFNGVAHPALGVWRESGEFDLLRTFGYEDYRSRL
jgi:carboxynorspermidine decarboxylase